MKLSLAWRHFLVSIQYLVIPAAGLLSPLLLIPVVASRFGADGWAALALAQSIGVSIATATEMGWGVVGPQRVAEMAEAERPALFRQSLTSRAVPVTLGMLIAAAAAWMLASSFRLDCAVLAFAMAAQGLTSSWYFVGLGRPMNVFWCEGAPRLGAAIIASVGVALGAPLGIYGLAVLVSLGSSLAIARSLVGWREGRVRRSDWTGSIATVRAQGVLALGRAVSVVYTALPVALVQLFAPGATATFAACERLMRMSVQVVGTLPMRLQSWIGEVPPGSSERRDRARKAARLLMVVGVVVACTFAVGLPATVDVLFHGHVDVSRSSAIASALVLCAICWSTALGLTLVSLGDANSITRAIIPSAAVGLSTIGPLAVVGGPVGAAVGELLAELTGYWIQRCRIRRLAVPA